MDIVFVLLHTKDKWRRNREIEILGYQKINKIEGLWQGEKRVQ
jgi:hypothetical protein